MRLKTVDGQLTLGSTYKLFAVGWALGVGLFMGLIFLLVVFGVAITGVVTVNGVEVHGRSQALLAMAPFVVIMPIIVVLQSFAFAGLLTLGVWAYRLRRPLLVVDEARREA